MLLGDVVDLLADVDHLDVADAGQEHRDGRGVIGVDVMGVEGFLDLLDEAAHREARPFAPLHADEGIDVIEADQ